MFRNQGQTSEEWSQVGVEGCGRIQPRRAKLKQFSDARRVCGRASDCQRCIRRACCIPECEDPVKEAKFERAVMADSVSAEVRHGVDRDHCFYEGCVRYCQCVLSGAA